MTNLLDAARCIIRSGRWPPTCLELQKVIDSPCGSSIERDYLIMYQIFRAFSEQGEARVTEQTNCSKYVTPVLGLFREVISKVTVRRRIGTLLRLIESGAIRALNFSPHNQGAYFWLSFMIDGLYCANDMTVSDMREGIHKALTSFCLPYASWHESMTAKLFTYQSRMAAQQPSSHSLSLRTAQWCSSEIFANLPSNDQFMDICKSVCETICVSRWGSEFNNNLPWGFDPTCGECLPTKLSPSNPGFIQNLFVVSGMTDGLEWLQKTHSSPEIVNIVIKGCQIQSKRESILITLFLAKLVNKGYEVDKGVAKRVQTMLRGLLSEVQQNTDQLAELIDAHPSEVCTALFDQNTASSVEFERALVQLCINTKSDGDIAELCSAHESFAYGLRCVALRVFSNHANSRATFDDLANEPALKMMLLTVFETLTKLGELFSPVWFSPMLEELTTSAMKPYSWLSKDVACVEKFLTTMPAEYANRTAGSTDHQLASYLGSLVDRLVNYHTDQTLPAEFLLVVKSGYRPEGFDMELVVNTIEQIGDLAAPDTREEQHLCKLMVSLINFCTTLSSSVSSAQAHRVIDGYVFFTQGHFATKLAVHVPAIASFALSQQVNFRPLDLAQAYMDAVSEGSLNHAQNQAIMCALCLVHSQVQGPLRKSLLQERWMMDAADRAEQCVENGAKSMEPVLRGWADIQGKPSTLPPLQFAGGLHQSVVAGTPVLVFT